MQIRNLSVALYAVVFYTCLRLCLYGPSALRVNPYSAKLIYFNFLSLEVVSRYRDPQPQVIECYSYFFLILDEIFANLDI